MKMQLDLFKNVWKFKKSYFVFIGILIWSETSKEFSAGGSEEVKGEGVQIVMKFISLLSQQNAVQGYDKITTLI